MSRAAIGDNVAISFIGAASNWAVMALLPVAAGWATQTGDCLD
jgi:hypothetical protein